MTAREWVLEIDPPAGFLTANDRRDRRLASGRRKAWREAAWAAARQARLPTGLARVRIDVVIEPPHRRVDKQNYRPTSKVLVDGLGPPFVRPPSGRSRGAAAPGHGLIPNDNPKHLDGEWLHLGDPHPPRGRVRVYVADLTDVPPGRTWTPTMRAGAGHRLVTKRACNGCDRLLGDVTDDEIDCAVAGRPLPDVRAECPTCSQATPSRTLGHRREPTVNQTSNPLLLAADIDAGRVHRDNLDMVWLVTGNGRRPVTDDVAALERAGWALDVGPRIELTTAGRQALASAAIATGSPPAAGSHPDDPQLPLAVDAAARHLPGVDQWRIEAALQAAQDLLDRHAEADAKRMIDETFLGGLTVEDGATALRLILAHDLAARMCLAFKTLLEAHGGDNYVEQEIGDRDGGGRYVFIVCRPGGKTPHHLRRHAEQEAQRLTTTLARVRAIHQQYLPAHANFYTCAGCSVGMELVPWPCPTVQVLDGEDPTEPAVLLARTADMPSQVGGSEGG